MSNSAYLKSNGWKHKAGGWWVDPRAEKGAPLVKTATAEAKQQERDAQAEIAAMAPVKTAEGFGDRYTPNPNSDSFRRLKAVPGVWNGFLSVYRYRITVERIEEPREEIVARMVALYNDPETGMRGRESLRAEAKRLGVDLVEEVKRAQKETP